MGASDEKVGALSSTFEGGDHLPPLAPP